MNSKTVYLGLLTIVLCLCSILLSAQQQKTWEGFSDQQELTDIFESKTEKLLKSARALTIAQAAKQLDSTEGIKVKISKVKQRSKVLNASKLAKLIRPSFVSFATAFDCGNCHHTHLNIASGYIISSDGLVVTNHHVIKGFIDSEQGKSLAMVIQTHDGEVFTVEKIVSSFKDGDLAIVKVNTQGKKLTPLPLGHTAYVGDDIYVMSNPAPMINYFSTGKVARNHLAIISATKKLPQTDITADYAAGSSGAPIVDRYGNLISTVSSTHSIYYDMENKDDLQMVVKQTIPVILLRELIVM